MQNDQHHNSIGTNKVYVLTVGNLVGTAVTGLSVGECIGNSVVGWGDGLWVGILVGDLVGIRVVGRDYTFIVCDNNTLPQRNNGKREMTLMT